MQLFSQSAQAPIQYVDKQIWVDFWVGLVVLCFGWKRRNYLKAVLKASCGEVRFRMFLHVC